MEILGRSANEEIELFCRQVNVTYSPSYLNPCMIVLNNEAACASHILSASRSGYQLNYYSKSRVYIQCIRM